MAPPPRRRTNIPRRPAGAFRAGPPQRRHNGAAAPPAPAGSLRPSERSSRAERAAATALAARVDAAMGFERVESGGRGGRARVGWLVNMRSTSVGGAGEEGEGGGRRAGEGAPAGAEGGGEGRAAVDYYFIGEEGEMFKAAVEYRPYFLVCVRRGREAEVEEWARRAWEGLVVGAEWVEKEDLSLVSFASGRGAC